MPQCKPFKRNFKTGQLVMLLAGSLPMRIIKYEDKLSDACGKHLVSVTWQEKKEYKIATYAENELMPFFIMPLHSK